MQHFNYSRQMVKQFTREINVPSVHKKIKQFMQHCIDLSFMSQKFILPDGGRLYDDPDYKALDETIPLSLPYPIIAIEFSRSHDYVNSNKYLIQENTQPNKALLFARQNDDDIVITVIVWSEFSGSWMPYPEVSIPRVNYLDRTQRLNGYAAIKLIRNPETNIYGILPPISDYGDEVGALLCMLNILQCKNVHVERSEPNGVGKKVKAALPFDTYHILTIDVTGKEGISTTGEHRSPREHLRRGHIRCLTNGRRIWVNATVVAAGRGAGVVTKNYAVR